MVDNKNNTLSINKNNGSVDDLKIKLDEELNNYLKNKETKPEEVLNYIAETKDNPWKWPERFENLKKYFENKYGKEDFKNLYVNILRNNSSLNNTFDFSIEVNGKKIEQEDQELFKEYMIERYNNSKMYENLSRKEIEELSKLDNNRRNQIFNEIRNAQRERNPANRAKIK